MQLLLCIFLARCGARVALPVLLFLILVLLVLFGLHSYCPALVCCIFYYSYLCWLVLFWVVLIGWCNHRATRARRLLMLGTKAQIATLVFLFLFSTP
jgi:hypothetical protein